MRSPFAVVGVGLVLWLGCDVRREARVKAPLGPEKPLGPETDPVEAEEIGTAPCARYPEAGPEGPFRLSSSGSIVTLTSRRALVRASRSFEAAAL